MWGEVVFSPASDGNNRDLPMLRGPSKVTLDDKGRIAIPSRYRDQLAERCQNKLVITVGLDRCLLVYPFPDWEVIEMKLVELSSIESNQVWLQRLILGHAMERDIDGAGRVLIPPELRDFAGLERHGMLIGQGRKFELWDSDSWYRNLDERLSGKREGDGGLPAQLETLSL